MTVPEAVNTRLSTLTTWVVVGLGFIVVFAVTMTVVLVWLAHAWAQSAQQVQLNAEESHQALCAYKLDIGTRYRSNKAILAAHPEDPVQVFNLVIPRDQLVQSVAAQKSAYDSLAALNCD